MYANGINPFSVFLCVFIWFVVFCLFVFFLISSPSHHLFIYLFYFVVVILFLFVCFFALLFFLFLILPFSSLHCSPSQCT